MDGVAHFPRVIWTLWLQGWSSAPEMPRACLESWRNRNPDWIVHALDERTLSNFIPRDRLEQILRTPRNEIEALSDRIRIELLSRYGGVWVDATTLCARPLDEWLPLHMSEGFFAFDKPGPDRMLASWFLAAEKGSYLVDPWRRRTVQYWHARRTRSDDYFWFHRLFAEGCAADPEFRRTWNAVPKVSAVHLFHFGPMDDRLMGPADARHREGLKNPPAPVFKLSHKQTRQVEEGSVAELLCQHALTGEVIRAAARRRLLVTWYGSFGHGTIGDLQAMQSAATHLVARGHNVDHATTRAIEIEGARRVAWQATMPSDYDAMIFVCGPILRHHADTTALFAFFRQIPRLGLAISLMERNSDQFINPFNYVLPREGGETDYGDLAIIAPFPTSTAKVRDSAKVALVLRGAQSEYGADRCLATETESLAEQAGHAALSAVGGGLLMSIENHLGRSAVEPDGIEPLYAQCDLVITSRFHGAIAALRNAIPFVAIDQITGSAKVSRLLRDLGWTHIYRADEASVYQLTMAATMLIRGSEKQELFAARRRAVIHANATLAALDRWLREMPGQQ